MIHRMDGTMKDEYIDRMVKNLPVLRTAAGFTQAQLGKKAGVSRQTIVAIENRKRSLPWSLYLAIVLVFMQNEDSKKLIGGLDLFDGTFINNI